MTSVSQLKQVLKQTLQQNGVLNQVRAKIRASIFNTLNDNGIKRPQLSNQNLIINQLIRQYLLFNNYYHTLGVFLPETGQPTEPPFDRSYITKKLKIMEDTNSRDLPLLYGIQCQQGMTFGMKKLIGGDQREQGKVLYEQVFKSSKE